MQFMIHASQFMKIHSSQFMNVHGFIHLKSSQAISDLWTDVLKFSPTAAGWVVGPRHLQVTFLEAIGLERFFKLFFQATNPGFVANCQVRIICLVYHGISTAINLKPSTVVPMWLIFWFHRKNIIAKKRRDAIDGKIHLWEIFHWCRHSRGFDSTHKTSYKTISWSKDIQRESLKQQSSLFLVFLGARLPS